MPLIGSQYILIKNDYLYMHYTGCRDELSLSFRITIITFIPRNCRITIKMISSITIICLKIHF